MALFTEKAVETSVEKININNISTFLFTNEFWTSGQRQAASIHEISYRACFKPQLPRFFIELLTEPGSTIYDPFSGRGTTAIETAILARNPVSNDINPLSKILTEPRLDVPPPAEVEKRLNSISLDRQTKRDLDLSMFYHPQTEIELFSLRSYLAERKHSHAEDSIDRWIRMVATNRLTGHSRGFFSVYTMPPNQAVSAESQVKINLKRNQEPEYRDVKKIIVKKSFSLLRNLEPLTLERLRSASNRAIFLEEDASLTAAIPASSIDLTVTSPPFLNVVQYSQDNWLRCWFSHIDAGQIDKKITFSSSVTRWSAIMGSVIDELYRITRPGGWVAFEVGEVNKGKVKLEEVVVPLGLNSGFECAGVLINRQNFTKTSNIWGVDNNRSGTNTNRVVLLKKPDEIPEQ